MSKFFECLFATIVLICYAMGLFMREPDVLIAGGLFAIAYVLCGRKG